MVNLRKEVFICLDCETTGLDLTEDRIIEIGAVRFTFSETLQEFESLIDPEREISRESMAIHHISHEMLYAKPKIAELLPTLLEFIKDHIIVGHGIAFDVNMIIEAAKRAGIETTLQNNRLIDTLRLARHYGESPTNSLEYLAKHFNVAIDDTHRAMPDVRMNIAVFKHLVSPYHSTEKIFEILSEPIKMKAMPLGKYKGRIFSEIPLDYLQWAARMDFDQDLLFSIRSEISRRKKGGQFSQATNPFSQL